MQAAKKGRQTGRPSVSEGRAWKDKIGAGIGRRKYLRKEEELQGLHRVVYLGLGAYLLDPVSDRN